MESLAPFAASRNGAAGAGPGSAHTARLYYPNTARHRAPASQDQTAARLHELTAQATNIQNAQIVHRDLKAFLSRDGMLGASTMGLHTEADRARVEEADEEVLASRDWTVYDNFTDSQAARESMAHNCHEQSILARDELRRHGIPALMLELAVDVHTTVIFHVGGQRLEPNALPNDMRTWDRHLHVYDPWSNLAPMPARDFPDAFRQRMNDLAAQGYWVRYNNGKVAPNDPNWLNAVLLGTKRSSEDGMSD
ncbi:hypothetical protein DWV00_32735 [Trinickia dinghuensis]|uniref:Uncharacterized protein n=1 Tax=Trinickia dinghuensis TaxID=2291023 RepID=A0A3D8JNF7_9BURK|nr:hypothetical protein DWV00_32735 [Trinickia dinghuensis]